MLHGNGSSRQLDLILRDGSTSQSELRLSTLPEDFELVSATGEDLETGDEKTEVVDMEDAIETQVIDLLSPEEEIAEILEEIDGSRE